MGDPLCSFAGDGAAHGHPGPFIGRPSGNPQFHLCRHCFATTDRATGHLTRPATVPPADLAPVRVLPPPSDPMKVAGRFIADEFRDADHDRNLLIHSRNSGFEGLPWVLPREREHPGELERFQFVIDLEDVMKLKARPNHDGTSFLRRREQKGAG